MEVYPQKRTVHRIIRVTLYRSYIQGIPTSTKIITVIPYHFNFDAKSQFEVYVSNDVAIDDATYNDLVF